MVPKLAKQQEARASAEPWAKLHEFGVRFIILDRLTHGKDFKLSLSAVPSWLTVTERPIDERFSVFRLDPSPDAPSARKECKEVAPNVWQVVDASR